MAGFHKETDLSPIKTYSERLIADFRDIGEKFAFLGIEMIVVSHSKRCLCANYVDKNGVIRMETFYHAQIPLLKKENGDE